MPSEALEALAKALEKWLRPFGQARARLPRPFLSRSLGSFLLRLRTPTSGGPWWGVIPPGPFGTYEGDLWDLKTFGAATTATRSVDSPDDIGSPPGGSGSITPAGVGRLRFRHPENSSSASGSRRTSARSTSGLARSSLPGLFSTTRVRHQSDLHRAQVWCGPTRSRVG